MLSRTMRRHQPFMLTAIPLLALAVSRSAAIAAPVRVEGGLLEGSIEDSLTVYRGIAYAAPPVGDLRWRPPQPAPKWQGVKIADKFSPACFQASPAIANLGGGPSEDCLYLNVWTPAKRLADRLPVMLWIHGGGFTAGATAERLYSGEQLAKKGVVVVTLDYRLGAFGFLAHPGLSGESGKRVSGNYGLLDMIAGLQWIQRNIAAFGGDPRRVTIFGESAGGIAVSMLCASPLAKGLFQGAISESGGSFGPAQGGGRGGGENMKPLADAEQAGGAWAAAAGASSVADMRHLPAEKVLAAGRGATWPIVDGWVIPDDQYKLYQAGRYNDTPILVGYNSDEGASFNPPKTPEAYVQSARQRFGPFGDKLLAIYAPGERTVAKTARDLSRDVMFGWHTWVWASLQTKTGKSKAFLYYFDQHPDYPADSPRAGYGAMHGSEIPYVFEHLGLGNRPKPSAEDEAISEAMAIYWTNFAKRGDPNGEGLPNWPAFNEARPHAMHFSHTAYAGLVVSEEGLNGLDSYFAWRRSGAADTNADGAAVGAAPGSGIAANKPVFGGACKTCPWGALGEIVKEMMRPYGYDVQVCYNCSRADAPRIVSEARLPPPYEPNPALGEALLPRNAPGMGPVDFGATAIQFLLGAYRGTDAYKGEKPRTNLRLLANIQSPNYVLVAAKKSTGITDLAQIREGHWPVRILAGGTGADVLPAILAYYGLSRESIQAAGGRVGSTAEDRNNFDVVIGGGGGLTTAPEWSLWTEISQKFDLNFIELPQQLLTRLAKDTEQETGVIPAGLYRGIDHPVRTVVRSGTVVYGRADMPDQFAYTVAKAIDERQDLLQWSHLNYSYNIHNVWKAQEVPLHPGAERYYKEMGYMK